MVEISLLCRDSEDICGYWRNRVEDLVSKANEALPNFARLSKVLLVVSKGGETIALSGDASSSPCAYDANIVVVSSASKLENLANAVLGLCRGVVAKVLDGVECPVTIIDGIAYSLAKFLSRRLSIEDLERYFAKCDERAESIDSSELRKYESLRFVKCFLKLPTEVDLSGLAKAIELLTEFRSNCAAIAKCARLALGRVGITEDVNTIGSAEALLTMLRDRAREICSITLA